MRVCTQCRQLLPASVSACPHDGGAVEDVAVLPADTRVAGYRIVRLLGEGGMGYVYEAVHEVLRRRTAMKFLRQEYASEPEVVTRFTQEAQAVNLVNHEHIVNVYDIGDAADGSVYFVMEYLEGKDLSEVQASRALPLPLLVHVYLQVLRGLQAAHAKQIVHRDLKPANVFITRREGNPYFVKLLDFGIAKLRDGTSRAVTREGAVLGTPSYMSPEQIQGQAVDHRSDIFTIGVMLYRAATGVAPFHGENFGALAAAIVGQEPRPIREVAPAANLPASLERLIHKALRKAADDRHQTVAEVLGALDIVRAEAGLAGDALAAAIAAIAGAPVEDVLPLSGSTPATRASLGESMPVFQGVPSAVAVQSAAPRSRRGLLVGGGLVIVAAAIAVLVMRGGGGDTTPAASAQPAARPDAARAAAPADTRFAALRAAGDPAAVRARAEAALSAEMDGDASSQGNVVAALALVGSPRTAPLLYRALQGGPEVRLRAVRALRELRLPEAAARLRAALSGSGDKLRVELAATMAVLGDADADAMLVAALADDASGLTAAAALAEAGRGAPARARLDEIYAATPRGRDRWRIAAEGLVRLGDAGARAALIEELAQPDARRAVSAAEVLVRLGDDAGAGYLERVVADADFAARPAAALALARSGGAGALAFVPSGLTSADPVARALAIAVVARLGAPGATHLDAIAVIADDDVDPQVRVVARAALWVTER